MNLSISTHWNAYLHGTGRSLIEQILSLGVRHVELGYDLRRDVAPDILAMVKSGEVVVGSVHNYCPIPIGAPQGHPELFDLSSTNERVRESAVRHTGATIEFAANMGAKAVVAHAGRVDMRQFTRRLIALAEADSKYSEKYDKLKLKLLVLREKKVAPYLAALERSLEELLPTLESNQVRLGLENLPSWEALPTESEALELCTRFASPWLGYWHDVGHAVVRENLGFISRQRWLEKLKPFLVGMHIHAVAGVASDHLLPPTGSLDVEGLAPFTRTAPHVVMEPAPGTPPADVHAAINLLQRAWGGDEESGSPGRGEDDS